jgi:hypothetical protein
MMKQTDLTVITVLAVFDRLVPSDAAMPPAPMLVNSLA